jgi:hypothetical protein
LGLQRTVLDISDHQRRHWFWCDRCNWFFSPEYTLVTLAIFLIAMFIVSFCLVVAIVSFKYKELKISENFYSPISVQRWESYVRILDTDGSAEIKIARSLNLEEDGISHILQDQWIESSGDDIRLRTTKLNGRPLVINPGNINQYQTILSDGTIFKNLKIKIPLPEWAVSPIELECELGYPSGAFNSAMQNRMDFYEVVIYHPTRLVSINVELSDNLAHEYNFDHPAFAVQDLIGNRARKEEERIRTQKNHPQHTDGKLQWDIVNPKIGLVYKLRFKVFAA